MMKVFLGGPFKEQEYLRNVAEKLKVLGMEVTSRWLNIEQQMKHVSFEEMAKYSDSDFSDVERSDVFVCYKPLAAYTGDGHAHEAGFALAKGIPVIYFGYPKSIYAARAFAIVFTEQALLALLKGMQQ